MMDKGCVIAMENLSDDTSREDIKDLFAEFGEVAWVDSSRGETKAQIRFKDADVAKAAYDGLKDAGKEIKGSVPTFRMLEGQEEKVCVCVCGPFLILTVDLARGVILFSTPPSFHTLPSIPSSTGRTTG